MVPRRVLDLDFDEIEKWFEARDMHMPPKSLFPKTGFIVEGVAAGFIYFTDSKVAILDCYISNKDADKQLRADAINRITYVLIKLADFHHCKLVKCDTKIGTIKEWAYKYKFKSTGIYESFVLEI